jgi:hypothetical protein
MAVVKDTIYTSINGEFNRVELIKVNFFRWEVAFFREVSTGSKKFDFYNVLECGTEESATGIFDGYKHYMLESVVAGFSSSNNRYIEIRKNGEKYDVINTNRLFMDGYRSQKGLNADEIIRYLANAAMR